MGKCLRVKILVIFEIIQHAMVVGNRYLEKCLYVERDMLSRHMRTSRCEQHSKHYAVRSLENFQQVVVSTRCKIRRRSNYN